LPLVGWLCRRQPGKLDRGRPGARRCTHRPPHRPRARSAQVDPDAAAPLDRCDCGNPARGVALGAQLRPARLGAASGGRSTSSDPRRSEPCHSRLRAAPGSAGGSGLNGTPPAPAIRSFACLDSWVHSIPESESARLIREGIWQADPNAQTPVVWMDVLHPGPAQAEFLRDEIGFHPLAVEDCVRGRQRPKVDRYNNDLFIVLYAAAINPTRDRMALNEIHVFLGNRFMVTVHDYRVE